MLSLLAAVVMCVSGSFVLVLSFVACYKVIQIAEDLRYIRSKSDIHVSRPKPTKHIVVMCVIVSFILVVLGLMVVTSLSSAVYGGFAAV